MRNDQRHRQRRTRRSEHEASAVRVHHRHWGTQKGSDVAVEKWARAWRHQAAIREKATCALTSRERWWWWVWLLAWARTSATEAEESGRRKQTRARTAAGRPDGGLVCGVLVEADGALGVCDREHALGLLLDELRLEYGPLLQQRLQRLLQRALRRAERLLARVERCAVGSLFLDLLHPTKLLLNAADLALNALRPPYQRQRKPSQASTFLHRGETA
eukprot:513066-Pleurochrysis_carterae.AAC.3